MSNRSTVLAGVLMVAFFVFITTRGQLLDYLGVIGLGPRANQWTHKASASSGGSSSPTFDGKGGIIGDINSIKDQASQFLNYGNYVADFFGAG